MAANSKIKRKQTSPKVGTTGIDSTSAMKAQANLKYTTGAMGQSSNFLDKYSSKTRNKVGQTMSAQQPV